MSPIDRWDSDEWGHFLPGACIRDAPVPASQTLTNIELREDGSFELREDGYIEFRE